LSKCRELRVIPGHREAMSPESISPLAHAA
jgi:hypothetical protein